MSRLAALLMIPMTVFMAGNALATSQEIRSANDRMTTAKWVVRGVVGPSDSKWAKGRDGLNRIYTVTELTVKEVLKGELDKSTIEIREIGGTIGQATLEVPAAAQFTRGEDIVVLLSNRDEDGAYELDGMGLGKFDVEKNANGEEVLASGGIEHEEKVVTLQSVRERFRGQKIQEKARSSGPAQPGQTANVEGKPPQPAEPSLTVSDPPLQSPKGTRAVLFAFLALGIFYFIIRRNRKSRLKS